MTPLPYAYAFEPHGSSKPELFLERARAESRAGSTRGVLHMLWNHPPIDDKRLQRAVEIADEAMVQVIRDNCIPSDEVGVQWEVPEQCELAAEVFDAIAWLGDRKLLTMTSDATIVLLIAGRRS